MTSDDHWTRANQIVSDTIESTTSADFAPHYNYLSQPAGFEEEEEDDRGREGHGQATQALMPAPNPFALRQDYTASPATMPQMVSDTSLEACFYIPFMLSLLHRPMTSVNTMMSETSQAVVTATFNRYIFVSFLVCQANQVYLRCPKVLQHLH